ncbi:hypothetical protein V6N12_070908 [Hibiscus sabdariffa]|uniref:Uncharacterized protein n=1 Tax=Hibiscus sabdariffa TaxID=183260 RepID=A0ABR2FI89_9ROSI
MILALEASQLWGWVMDQLRANARNMGRNGLMLSKVVKLWAVDEDPNSLSPGDAVMAQEVLVDNLIVSIGSKAVEREELSEKILSVLEHQEMDHVTLNYHSFN